MNPRERTLPFHSFSQKLSTGPGSQQWLNKYLWNDRIGKYQSPCRQMGHTEERQATALSKAWDGGGKRFTTGRQTEGEGRRSLQTQVWARGLGTTTGSFLHP